MGFGRKSRKEAQQQQLQAMQLQQNAYNQQNQRVNEYNANFNTRNAGVIGLNKDATSWLERFKKGEDVSTLNPAFNQTAQDAADATAETMRVASRFGDNATHGVGDAGYAAKVQNVGQRNIAKGLARMNMDALGSEANNQRGILMDTANFLNSDARAGLNMGSDLFGMTNAIFNSATTRRQIEIQRSNQMMGNFMSALSGGATGLLTAFNVGGFGR